MPDIQKPLNEYYDEIHLFGVDQAKNAQIFMCFPSDLDNIQYRRIKELYYRLDQLDSPVIEYCRPGISSDTKLLVSGRIWFEYKYWDKDEEGNDILLSKSTELLRLYESLERWIRRYSKRLPDGFYIGKHAKEMVDQGLVEIGY